MSSLLCRERTLPRSEAQAFFHELGSRSPIGPFLFSVALLNVTTLILTLAAP